MGDWREGSGWVDIFKRSIKCVERTESFLVGENVKRSRYAQEVSLALLVYLSNIAFKDQNEFDSYDI